VIHEDASGSFQELAHSNDVEFGQLSILRINLGCVRGGHYHTHKKEWFCCIHGKCKLELVDMQSDKKRTLELSESNRVFVLVNPYEKHTVINIGKEVCEILIIASEIYKDSNADTWR
jgi:UDP-2-acetamido-2,6-beta-L-arabino-hexul-4-ose reductase